MTKVIEIKHWRTKEVLFSYECEDNTLRKTIEEAVKQGVSLAYADLCNVVLSGANLSGADLYGAKICYTDLINANLSKANLSYAELYSTNLINVNLSGANLLYTNLTNANLDWTNLNGTTINYPMNLPEGEFIAWKRVYRCKNRKSYIVKLKVLADSKRSRATTDKCRCDKALVMEIQTIEGKKSKLTEVATNNYIPCAYHVGEMVYADEWDENRFHENSHGIHFFLDRQKAVEY